VKSRNAVRWSDENVVITGGSQGIGLALATELAGRCKTLTIIARDAERLRRVAEKLQCDYISADVSDLQALALPALANCSTLICCAAEVTPGRVTELTPDVFRRQMEINFVGIANAVRNTLPDMVKTARGTIVLMGSTASLIGIYGYSAYGPTKAAINSYAASLRAELAGEKIRVVVAYPPDTETPGLAVERAIRPPETTAIVGTIKAKSAEYVARRLVEKLDGRSNSVTFDPLTALLVRYATVPDKLVGIYSRVVLGRLDCDSVSVSGVGVVEGVGHG
jgi:3-dehydrosphinganine reductase